MSADTRSGVYKRSHLRLVHAQASTEHVGLPTSEEFVADVRDTGWIAPFLCGFITACAWVSIFILLCEVWL